MARYFNPDLPGGVFDPPFPQTDRPKADRQTGKQTQSQAGKHKGRIHKTEQSTSQLYCNHLTVLDRNTHRHMHTARTCAHAQSSEHHNPPTVYPMNFSENGNSSLVNSH